MEAVAVDRSLRDVLSGTERIRLTNAAGDVYCPNVEEFGVRSKVRRKWADKLHRSRWSVAQQGVADNLDIVDGAARVVVTIINGSNTGTHTYGS